MLGLEKVSLVEHDVVSAYGVLIQNLLHLPPKEARGATSSPLLLARVW